MCYHFLIVGFYVYSDGAKTAMLNCSTTKIGRSELVSAESNTHYFSEQRHCYWMTFDLYADATDGVSRLTVMKYCNSDAQSFYFQRFYTVCIRFGFPA